jgi:uncharacterized DUF497 family protein
VALIRMSGCVTDSTRGCNDCTALAGEAQSTPLGDAQARSDPRSLDAVPGKGTLSPCGSCRTAVEAINRRKHGLDFPRVGEVLAAVVVNSWDDRPLGYEEEGRVRLLRRLGTGTVVVLVFEPVDLDQGEMAVRPISSRRAEPHEARDDRRVCGGWSQDETSTGAGYGWRLPRSWTP